MERELLSIRACYLASFIIYFRDFQWTIEVSTRTRDLWIHSFECKHISRRKVKNSTRFRLTQVLRYWMLTKVLFLFQTNNRQVISGAANGGVRVWDVISGECLQHLRGHVKSVTAVTCTAEHLLSVSLESVLCIWDRARGECLHRLKQVRGSEEAS